MNRWNETSDRSAPGYDRWVERTRVYLRSRTADHWLMFIAGLLIGALVA